MTAIPSSSEAFEAFVQKTVRRDSPSFAPGWSGNGEPAQFLNQTFPAVLRRALATTPGFTNEIATIEYAGSYRRRTTTTVCDVDIIVHTESTATHAFQQAFVKLLVAELESVKGSNVTLSDGAIRIAMPRNNGPNRYALLFAQGASSAGIGHQISLKRLYHNPASRTEADAALDAFYRNNRGAQHVSRLLKYHIYALKPCLSLYHVDAVVRGIALLKKRGKSWCTKHQGEFYREVLGELALGLESIVLTQMLEDAWAYDEEVKKSGKKRGSKGRLGLTPYLYEGLWKQIECLAEFFWEPWNQENIRVKNNPENFFGELDFLPQFTAVWVYEGGDCDTDLISSLSVEQLAKKLGWVAADDDDAVLVRGASKDGNMQRVKLDVELSDAQKKKMLLAERVPATRARRVGKNESKQASNKPDASGEGASRGKKKPKTNFENVEIPLDTREFELFVLSAIPNCAC